MLVLSLLLKAFCVSNFHESTIKMVYNKDYRHCSWIVCITDSLRLFYFNFYHVTRYRHNRYVVRKLRGTIVNIILPPRVLFHCREIYFTAATFILLPRVLFYCREIYFTAASFILVPRVLFYCREFYYTAASFILPPRVLFSPPRVLFYCKWWK